MLDFQGERHEVYPRLPWGAVGAPVSPQATLSRCWFPPFHPEGAGSPLLAGPFCRHYCHCSVVNDEAFGYLLLQGALGARPAVATEQTGHLLPQAPRGYATFPS